MIDVFLITLNANITLEWRHNGRDGVSNHQLDDCLLNLLSRRRSKKTSKFRVTGLCVGNSPVTGEFPAQRASNAENVSIWWRHHDRTKCLSVMEICSVERDLDYSWVVLPKWLCGMGFKKYFLMFVVWMLIFSFFSDCCLGIFPHNSNVAASKPIKSMVAQLSMQAALPLAKRLLNTQSCYIPSELQVNVML